ncbi:MAG: hypothetical protein JXE07_04920, partial [Candidatus Aminicenantes bacterium]|nr:hypothetical protein [Candidatus Aminicenantes bacterium]
EEFMKKLSLLLSFLLALSAFAGADVYVKSKSHTDAFAVMGQSQPAKDETIEQWIGDDKFAHIGPEMSSIVDLKKNMMVLITHKDKSYVETELPLDISKLLPKEMAQMMAGMMKMTVTVTPNNQSKTIGQWKCSGYDASIQMMMMPIKMAVWASTDVPVDMEKFSKIYSNVIKAQLRLDDAAMAEMMKIKGYWIATETTAEMMGAKMRSATEVVEMTKKNPPAGVYSVPSGYTKKEFLSMEALQQR